MYQSNYVEISRSALRQNALSVQQSIPVPVIGIVKCNGYGVTIFEAASAWQAAGITMFGVSKPEEALKLRQLGFQEDILLLCPVADIQVLDELLKNDIILTVSSFENAAFYAKNAPKYPIRVHIAIDTGMGRFGIDWKDLAQAKAVYRLSQFSFEGIFSHFSCAFEQEYRVTKRQLDRFLYITQTLQAEGYCVGMRHIANSCAALRFPETMLDAVRIGSALVGKLPVNAPIALNNVGIFRAQVVDCKLLHPGDTTGYGGYCKLKKKTPAVVVALGKEDGFGVIAKPDQLRILDFAVYLHRLLYMWLHPPYVIYKGKPLPIVGRIGNQYTLFDATDTNIKPGDLVEWNGNLMLSTCQRRFI